MSSVSLRAQQDACDRSRNTHLRRVRRIRAATPSFARSASAVATAREHKATVTLAAVLGAFLVCWLPYFIYFTCMGLRRETHPPLLAHSVVLWLGYFNSAVNPILYPALNRDFRQAYRQLLRCRVARKRLPASPRVLVRERGAVSHGCQRKHSRSEPSAINPRETMDESSPEHTSPCLAGKSEMQA